MTTTVYLVESEYLDNKVIAVNSSYELAVETCKRDASKFHNANDILSIVIEAIPYGTITQIRIAVILSGQYPNHGIYWIVPMPLDEGK